MYLTVNTLLKTRELEQELYDYLLPCYEHGLDAVLVQDMGCLLYTSNACDMEELLESVKSNKKFLYSAFYGFTNENAMDFFEKEGLKLKVERGNRVFPLSDRSADVPVSYTHLDVYKRQ